MISKIRSGWKALRGNFWASLAVDVVLLISVFVLISMWQTRNLPDDEHTPLLEPVWLDDMRAESVLVSGETGVVYFFAPWCFYCRKSIDNLIHRYVVVEDRVGYKGINIPPLDKK